MSGRRPERSSSAIGTVPGRRALARSVIAGLLVGQLGAASDRAQAVAGSIEPTGTLISVGDHRLHLHCTGQGSPVVVLEAGLGGNHLDWVLAQPSIGRETTVCSYDRAGYGWSEAGPKPRTVSRIAAELRELLHAAELHGPLVLAGHSFGGLVALYYASRYAEDVGGVVLVDSMHPEQYERFRRDGIEVPLEPSRAVIHSSPDVLTYGIPSEHRDLAYALASTEQARSYLFNELRSMPTSLEEMRALDLPELRSAVLAHGNREWDRIYPDGRMEDLWLRLQLELSSWLNASGLIVAWRSGHQVPLDDADIVVRTILGVVDEVRGTTPSGR